MNDLANVDISKQFNITTDKDSLAMRVNGRVGLEILGLEMVEYEIWIVLWVGGRGVVGSTFFLINYTTTCTVKSKNML